MPAPYLRRLPELPADQRRDLRYHCGFGCVRCGVTIYEYLALPPLEKGKMATGPGDDGPAATMLCPPCHALVENDRLTVAQVHGFHASPIARQRNFARDRLPFSNDLPELVIGGSRNISDTPVPVTMAGTPLLIFAPPREGVGATRITVRLGGTDGEPVHIVDANEWLVTDGSWRFAQRGDRYVFAAAEG